MAKRFFFYFSSICLYQGSSLKFHSGWGHIYVNIFISMWETETPACLSVPKIHPGPFPAKPRLGSDLHMGFEQRLGAVEAKPPLAGSLRIFQSILMEFKAESFPANWNCQSFLFGHVYYVFYLFKIDWSHPSPLEICWENHSTHYLMGVNTSWSMPKDVKYCSDYLFL